MERESVVIGEDCNRSVNGLKGKTLNDKFI